MPELPSIVESHRFALQVLTIIQFEGESLDWAVNRVPFQHVIRFFKHSNVIHDVGNSLVIQVVKVD